MEENSFSSVIKNRGFLNLWINQILVQLAYNSLNFALIIWVFQLTNSNTAVSALMFCIYLPAVLFGLFTGVLVDITDRKKIIMIINLLLSLSFLSLVFLKEVYPAILLIAFLINILSQLYAPAESSAIPIIVKRPQLLVANSLFSTTLFASFLIGFGLAGPLIELLGINLVFISGGLTLLVAFLLTFAFPPIRNKADTGGQRLIQAFKTRDLLEIKEIGLREIRNTMELIRGKLTVFSCIMILAGVQAVVGVLAVLIPAFFELILQINATNASYVSIVPLGVGMVFGGFLIGKFGNHFPKRRIVGIAIVMAGLLLFLVGIAPLISPVIKHLPKPRPLPFFYQPPLSIVMAIGSFLLGMAMVSIIIPTQTVLQENTPEEDRGKVFAILGVAMAGLTLIPVLFAGILADIFGVQPIFLLLGGSIALIGLFTLKPDFFFDKNHLPFRVRRFLGLGHWEK